jgi:hypothetical protein
MRFSVSASTRLGSVTTAERSAETRPDRAWWGIAKQLRELLSHSEALEMVLLHGLTFKRSRTLAKARLNSTNLEVYSVMLTPLD